LVGGEKMVNEVLRQTLELQAVLLTARKFWGSQPPPNRWRLKMISVLELWSARLLLG
jgi:hypothetical protein